LEGDEVLYAREATGFPGIAMILRLDSEVAKGGVVSRQETRYMITSLGGDEVSPKRLMNLVRGHWSVDRTDKSSPSTLVQWSRVTDPGLYTTLASFRSATGQETDGSEIDGGTIDPFFVDAAPGDYRLRTDSVAIGAGVALPADIAAAIGVAARIPVNLGILTWMRRGDS
jgi:hypothetical protein